MKVVDSSQSQNMTKNSIRDESFTPTNLLKGIGNQTIDSVEQNFRSLAQHYQQ
jgi:hypothetical protein